MTKEQKRIYKLGLEAKLNSISKQITQEIKDRIYGHHVIIKDLAYDYFRWTEELDIINEELGENEIPF